MDVQEWLNNTELGVTIWNNKYRHNLETFESWLDRVSGNNKDIRALILDKKFLFAGRTLSNRGTDDGSFSNCYSIGYVPDSLKGILDVNSKIALTYQYQGGQGLSLSKIRPKGAKIKEDYTSDGIIPFLKMFNVTTETISQGGSRKGALMASLDIWHPEAKDFITIKSDLEAINKANLSLEIDSEFMRIVNDNTDNEEYKVEKIFKYEDKEFKYDVYPVKLFNLLCKQAKETAEPGVLFTDRLRNYNLMQGHPEYKIETTNPCGEQPLPKHGACNLGSINLSEYIDYPYTREADFNYIRFMQDIYIIVEAMDDVLEENLDRHALIEQKEMAENYRNIGIGVMGLADAFVKLGLTYGSPDSTFLVGLIMHTLFKTSVKASVNLAQKRGSFPKYNPLIWESDIIKKAFNSKEIEDLKSSNCLRNCSLLSVAPTGSIGTMLNVSTGVEPFFRIKYVRKTESLTGQNTTYDVYIKAAKDYLDITGKNSLPTYFVDSSSIDKVARVNLQGTMQDYVDTAISSTINLPASTTTEEVAEIYLQAWNVGLKGCTIYVEGSRDAILQAAPTNTTSVRKALKRPVNVPAQYYQVKVGGTIYTVLIGMVKDKPYEVFTFALREQLNLPIHEGVVTKIGKRQYTFKSQYITIPNLELTNENIEEKATTLFVSMLLRHNVDIKYILKTVKKVNENISSFSSALSRILSIFLEAETLTENCPECSGTLIMEGGCIHCVDCGYSKCG